MTTDAEEKNQEDQTTEAKEKEKPKTRELMVNMPMAGLSPQLLRIVLEAPEHARENLLHLSDEELAHLTPDELEKVLQVNENFLKVKQASREVDAILSEEQMASAIQQKMQEDPNLSRDDAETLVLKATGQLGAKPIQVIQPPQKSSIEKLFEEVMVDDMREKLKGKGGGAPNTGGGLSTLQQTVKIAREGGATSLMLPDGSILQIGAPQESYGSQLVDEAMQWGRERLAAILRGEGANTGGGGLSPEDVMSINNPEVLRIILEDKAKAAEREATMEMAKGRNATLKAFADIAGAITAPGGADNLLALWNIFKTKNQDAGAPDGQSPQAAAPTEVDKFPPIECGNPKCKHIQRIQRGMPEYVCEKCGETNEDIEWP